MLATVPQTELEVSLLSSLLNIIPPQPVKKKSQQSFKAFLSFFICSEIEQWSGEQASLEERNFFSL